MLVCPKCRKILNKYHMTYRCENGHHFDIAKRGYVHLLLGNRKQTGDNKDMVKARSHFLHNNFYQPLAHQVMMILASLQPKKIVDAGCGEGYYTNQIAKALPDTDIYAFDLSKYAVHEACKSNQKVLYAVCSIADLPLESNSMDVILSIFAPIQDKEFHRVIKEDGYFVKVAPGPKHLYEMKQVLYTNVYDNPIQNNYEGFELQRVEVVDYDIELFTKEDIQALFMMTPYYWKSPIEGSKKLASLTYLKTRVQFQIELYRRVIK